MQRIPILGAILVCLGLAVSGPVKAAPDLFTISGVTVDVTAESASVAHERALAQGRPVAWQRLYRRLTPPSAWPQQPQLDDSQLQRIVRSIDVANERRSTTRYLADVTYHFSQSDVQRILRQAGVPFAETQSRPAVVIPLINGKGYDPAGPWTSAWKDPTIAQGLVPVVVPDGGSPILGQPDLANHDWSAFAPLAHRYNATEVVVAVTNADGSSVQVTQIDSDGRDTAMLTLAHPSFAAAADAASQKIAENWKQRAAIDYSQRSNLPVDVVFAPGDWPKIRARVRQVRAVADMEVQGFSTSEAQVKLVYYGRPEQLADVMAQQNLNFDDEGGVYVLQLGSAPDTPAP